MHIERILILEDDPEVLAFVRDALRSLKYRTESAETIAKAQKELQSTHYDLILCDVRLPDGDGLDFLRKIQKEKDPPICIMMSGYATIESATEAMRLGAVDYLVKPFTADQLEVALKQAETWKRMVTENSYLRSQQTIGLKIDHVQIGESSPMQEVKKLIQQIGPTNATVLISGESGTGKELVAHALFESSPRRDRPFIKFNCAAIPENLMESELFGHEKGSFTGAANKRLGRFEIADGGTLLLDEISEIPLPLQAKLLRVLQEREFERVGGNHTISVDVRILATTNRDLKAAVSRNAFREDLFYRLNVVPIQLPPLRNRSGDIRLLLDHFLHYFSDLHGKPLPTVSDEAFSIIEKAPWPGNIRELQNAVERAVILAEPLHPLQAADFSLVESVASASIDTTSLPEDLSLARMERRLIQAALQRTGGNKTRAANLLGISVRTIQYKLQDKLQKDKTGEESQEPS